MARGRLHARTLGDVRTLFGLGAVGGLSDGQLLDRFLERRDEVAEAAFAALVARHGPMVLRACRGVLRDLHDAQDAFQATFLVLARRAGSIRSRDSVASWLYGVACRVSARARVEAARRRTFERRGAEMAPRRIEAVEPPETWPELLEEVDRLPEKFRSPIVLIDLEGCTQQEAAQRLGWPLGTLQSRLARGRGRLRARLLRRGLAPSAGLLVAMVGPPGVSAMPAELIDPTARAAMAFAAGSAPSAAIPAAAAALAKGVLKTMLMLKWKTAATLTAVSLLGAGVFTHLAPAARPWDVGAVAIRTRTATDDAQDKVDKDKLKGTWKAVSSVDDGQDEPDPGQYELIFDGDAVTVRKAGRDFFKGTFTLNTAVDPKTIDLSITEGKHEGGRMLGIYTWDGGRWKWCTTTPQGGDRPREFTCEPGSGHLLVVLKKE